MLNSVILTTNMPTDHRRENMRRLTGIYVTHHERRRPTLVNIIADDKPGYYQKMLDFVITYCDDKVKHMKDKSLIRGVYNCQFFTSFMLIDYIMEWEETIDSIRYNFYDVSDNIPAKTSSKHASKIYPSPYDPSNGFVDLMDNHLKSKFVIEMFLLRCLFDIKYAMDNRRNIINWGNNNGHRTFNAVRYMKRLHLSEKWRLLKGSNFALYEETLEWYLKYIGSDGSRTTPNLPEMRGIGDYFN